MFVVFAFFTWFLAAGKPLSKVPILFVAVIVVSALLGAGVANLFSEPMNRWLRSEPSSLASSATAGRVSAD
jgi:peptidoglycan/LPS O-acetylase OafA/YrhL